MESSPSVGARPTVVAATGRRRVEVTGADRLRYLEDVTTQELAEARPGEVLGALYLDAHGAPLAVFDVLVLAESVALVAPDDGVASTLVDVLGSRTFLLDARFAATDDVVLALRGDGAPEVAAAANVGARAGTVRPAGRGVLAVGLERGVDVVVPRAIVDEVLGALRDAGAIEGAERDLEIRRIDAGEPAWGREVVAPQLPEEYGLLSSHVHLAKGCYPGQEAVARMWMLGRPRRRLAVVVVHGPQVVPGWTSGAGRRAATVTSVSPEGDRALAFVPPDAEPGSRFGTPDDGEVEVVTVVGVDRDPPGHDPATRRRRDTTPARR